MFNSKSLVALALAVVSFNALADGGDVQPFVSTPSALTRAEVRVDLAKAMAAGTIAQGELAIVESLRVASRSRAEVLAELREAQRLGLTRVGEVGAPIATAEQLQRIQRAGERAATTMAQMPG